MVIYFPAFFPKGGNRQQVALRVRRVQAMLESIIDKESKQDDAIFSIEKEILESDKPNIWNAWTPGNMERVLEVEFRKFGIAVMEHSSESIEKITTFTFYSTVEHLKEKFAKK